MPSCAGCAPRPPKAKQKRRASRNRKPSSTVLKPVGIVLAPTNPRRLKPALLVLPSYFLITFTSIRRNYAQDARRASPERQRTVSTGGARNPGTHCWSGAHQGASLRYL